MIIERSVYPSEEHTVVALGIDDTYNGAHQYSIYNCLGFADGKTSYDRSTQTIQFVKKLEDGTVVPGLQSEQLVIALIDRHQKLNARFPSPHNEKALAGLEMFLEAQRERVEERMSRGIMGELKR